MTKSRKSESESRTPSPEPLSTTDEQRATNNEQPINSLINETSPYLLQHAHNPVQWYPWSEEALTLARQEDKPILLSIGYSACHWCHVMAHESFEDPETAQVMNRYFVNIKVDREERPDLDRIYQTAQQLLTQRSGGWPLTMILSPEDHVPFFGGTYFPPQPRFGLPGFRELLLKVAELYEKERDAINKQNTAVVEALKQLQQTDESAGTVLDSRPIPEAVREFSNYFDTTHGGFGDAPKFPQSPNLEFLMSINVQEQPEAAKAGMEMVDLTLTRMGKGGIYDQLGGGFCRYAVDQSWLIPHFEKMLYDNGALLCLYAQAWKLTGNDRYRRITRESADWMIRDMQSGEGGFYSSLDADSEGEEGQFYVWTPDEIKRSLHDGEYDIFSRAYGLEHPANFEGRWHLHVTAGPDELVETGLADRETVIRTLESARTRLLDVRNRRVWPGRDEKILTAWNALAIRGMAMAALRLENDAYYESAGKAMAFIYQTMWDSKRLYASYKDGKRHLNAYLDDYVYLIDALLTLLSIRWDSKWLVFAQDLAEVLMDRFFDTTGGGFYFTSHDHETLLQRRRDFMDDATPSGNGIAARVMLELSHLTGNRDFFNAAEMTIKAAWRSLVNIPHAHASLLHALNDYYSPPAQIIIRGNPADITHWQKHCYELSRDIRMRIYAIPGDAVDLPGFLAQRQYRTETVAYVCEGFSCREPVHTLEQLISGLKL